MNRRHQGMPFSGTQGPEQFLGLLCAQAVLVDHHRRQAVDVERKLLLRRQGSCRQRLGPPRGAGRQLGGRGLGQDLVDDFPGISPGLCGDVSELFDGQLAYQGSQRLGLGQGEARGEGL